jgi:polygalacturonase
MEPLTNLKNTYFEMKHNKHFLIIFFFAFFLIQNANASLLLPNIPATQFLITNYGASTSNANNATAINATITAANAAGGGTVVIPADASPFLSGPITMKSNVNLFISAGATLQLMPYGNGNGLPAGSYPNNGTADTYDNFIFGQNLTNIEVSGTGTIEGNGAAWWAAYNANSNVKRPCVMRFKACHTVLVKDIHFHNAPNVHLTFGQSGSIYGDNGTISNVTIYADVPSPNTDAVDIWYWNGVDIVNCNFSVGDDNVAIDSYTSNINIKDCTFGRGHGVSVGSYTTNSNNVTVDNCTFTGTDNGIRLKSNNTRGGGEHTFSYSNITMTNVKNPFYITSWYPKEPTAAPSTLLPGTVVSNTPSWTDVTFKNITVTGSTNAGIIYALPEAYATNVVFDNVKIAATSKGMVANFVTGLEFKNCSSITIPSGKGAAIIPYKAETVLNSNVINGINITSGVSTSCNLSVNDVKSQNAFSIYPNPVKGEDFTIKTDSSIEKIAIYNLVGEKIQEQNGNKSTEQTVNIKGFAAGCYIIETTLDNGKVNTTKLIKE